MPIAAPVTAATAGLSQAIIARMNSSTGASGPPRGGSGRRATGLALVLLLAMGVGHLLYWLLTTVLK